MMRYRRTRATDGSEGSGLGPQQQVLQQAPSSGRGTWTGDSSQGAAAGLTRVHYPGQAAASGVPTGRSASAGPVSSSAQQQNGLGLAGAQAAQAKQQQQQQQYIVQRDKVCVFVYGVFVCLQGSSCIYCVLVAGANVFRVARNGCGRGCWRRSAQERGSDEHAHWRGCGQEFWGSSEQRGWRLGTASARN